MCKSSRGCRLVNDSNLPIVFERVNDAERKGTAFVKIIINVKNLCNGVF